MCIIAERDVEFIFSRAIFPELVEQDELQTLSIPILFRLDLIAQEEDETFTLTLTVPSGDLGANPTLRNSYSGVIMDATCNSKNFLNYTFKNSFSIFAIAVTFGFSEEDYREREGSTGFMPVIVAKTSFEIFLANPITFVVIPLTISEAEDRGLVPDVITVARDNIFSPSRAG